MKLKFIFSLLLVLTISSRTQLFAQHEKETENSEEFEHHLVAIVIGHTHVPGAFQSSSGTGTVIVASWGLNYDYWINEKWAIGLHTDMEIATYIIEDNTGSHIERERPIIVSIVGSYKPWRRLMVGAGFGQEIEPHHNFWVYRFGVEYAVELPNRWDLAPALVVDLKENHYHSWTIGLGVGKRF